MEAMVGDEVEGGEEAMVGVDMDGDEDMDGVDLIMEDGVVTEDGEVTEAGVTGGGEDIDLMVSAMEDTGVNSNMCKIL